MPQPQEVPDLLVVGAGSAGCVIAARASEDPNRTVLLVEAGPDYPQLADTPFDLVNSHDNSYRDHDWDLKYAPTRGREVRFPRGRVVGGSSAVNTTIALRSLPEDHAEWAAAGNGEWTWDRVLPAYCRLERDLDFGAAPFHGDAGPISIRRYPPAELLPQHTAFLDAARGLGYPDCADANDPDGWGAGPHPMNKLGRLRLSCAIAYLAPARARPNLRIRADTSVRRLLIEGGRCVGVEVTAADGTVAELRAKLVVLSAGAIMSPAILLRSGLGPRAEVEALGIDNFADVPGVGRNLCDHPALSVVCAVRDPGLIDFDAPIIQTILRYTADDSDKRNDLQIEQLSFAGRPGGPAMFAIAAVLEYQYGRGVLRLRSADPDAAPEIDNRFCEDDRDLARLVQCYRDTLAFTRAEPLAAMIDGLTFPDPARPLDDDAIASLCRKFAASGYHPSGTVKMGPASDPLAVVDQYGACHALDGLVVADASIMPSVPRANTNLTTIMIGERVGEWLRTHPARYGL
ncbi:MAG TPA: GMC family oxidoreductase N-terminal domain-containing protein [Pseudomonadales bacterium]|nr:GMC family oxidoreductase N-terminal domain-containing protein [Pseudomonadales bacterium]